MLRAWYLRRAVSWRVVLGFVGSAAVLVAVVARWESTAGLGLPLAALLCAAAAGFVLDDPAVAVTTVSPRGARWARMTRGLAATAPLLAGTALLLAAAEPGGRIDWILVVTGLGAAVLAVGAAAGARQVPRPGGPIASTVVLAGTAPLVVGLFFDLRSPYPVPDLTEGLRLFWAAALGVGVVAAATLLVGGGRP